MSNAELQKYYGFTDFRPGQTEVLEAVCDSTDVLGILPTSAGKSLLYQLPGLILRDAVPQSVVLVLSPLISLVADQVAGLNKRFGLTPDGRPRLRLTGDADVAAFLGSAQTDRGVEERAMRGSYAFLFLCPESLTRCLPGLSRLTLTLVAVDEAHVLSSHGFAFRPAYRTLGILRQTLGPTVPIVALTATANEVVARDIVQSLGFRSDHAVVRTSANRRNLFYEVHRKTNQTEDLFQIADLVRSAGDGSVFLYVLTRKETETIAAALASRHSIKARAYHAGLTTDERTLVMDSFMTGGASVMVCTIACGMGIDHQGVTMVIHYGLPRDLSAYVQESGRAGRSGARSRCVLFAGPGDTATQFRFLDDDDASAATQRKKKAIKAMAGYVGATTCRRRILLREFGETLPPGRCTLDDGTPGCDRCQTKPDTPLTDCTAVALALLRGWQTLRFTGATRLLDFCAGSRSKKIQALAGRPGYGSCSGHTKSHLKAVLQALIEADFFRSEVSDKGFPMLKLGAKGRVLDLSRPNQPSILLGVVQPTRSVHGVLGSKPPNKRRALSSTKTGGVTSSLLNPRASDTVGGPRAKKGKLSSAVDALDPTDRPLYEALRQWRFRVAKAKRVPVYVPCTNAVLAALATQRPSTLAGLSAVPGLGERKIQEYGASLLAVLAQHNPSL